MQERSARAIDSACVVAVERQNIARAACRVVEIHVRQALPTPPDAGHVAPDLTATVDHTFDYRVQSGDVTTSGKYPHSLRRHPFSFTLDLNFYYKRPVYFP